MKKPWLTLHQGPGWRRLCSGCDGSSGWGCHPGHLFSYQRSQPSQTVGPWEGCCPVARVYFQLNQRWISSLQHITLLFDFRQFLEILFFHVSYLLDPPDGWDVVHLSTPLVMTVVLAPLRHVPQILASTEVIMFIAYPSTKGQHPHQRLFYHASLLRTNMLHCNITLHIQ